jgi:hypothetical protein
MIISKIIKKKLKRKPGPVAVQVGKEMARILGPSLRNATSTIKNPRIDHTVLKIVDGRKIVRLVVKESEQSLNHD